MKNNIYKQQLQQNHFPNIIVQNQNSLVIKPKIILQQFRSSQKNIYSNYGTMVFKVFMVLIFYGLLYIYIYIYIDHIKHIYIFIYIYIFTYIYIQYTQIYEYQYRYQKTTQKIDKRFERFFGILLQLCCPILRYVNIYIYIYIYIYIKLQISTRQKYPPQQN